MTAAWSVKKLIADLKALQQKYNKAREIFDTSQDELKISKIELCEFNNKYGRVIAMMKADKED